MAGRRAAAVMEGPAAWCACVAQWCATAAALGVAAAPSGSSPPLPPFSRGCRYGPSRAAGCCPHRGVAGTRGATSQPPPALFPRLARGGGGGGNARLPALPLLLSPAAFPAACRLPRRPPPRRMGAVVAARLTVVAAGPGVCWGRGGRRGGDPSASLPVTAELAPLLFSALCAVFLGLSVPRSPYMRSSSSPARVGRVWAPRMGEVGGCAAGWRG